LEGLGVQLTLVFLLVLTNGLLAGSEIALISLRESQIVRLEAGSVTGKRLAALARDPNRFLATIQIGITLSGFLASATAAVSLAEPLIPLLTFAGNAARALAIVLVTLILTFITLVVGELAPKRLALQRAERWSMLVALPIHWASVASRPLVWVLSRSSDFVVRLFGGEPGRTREEVAVEELRDLIIAHEGISGDHQEVLVGAFEVAQRTVRQVLVPRSEVIVIDADYSVAQALAKLLEEGHSRAPVAPGGDLDDALGVAHLRDLVTADPDAKVSVVVSESVALPETVSVLAGLRRLQETRQQMALVVDEHGGVEGIVTVEDLIEELVGEIYDEADPDLIAVGRRSDGSFVVPGGFPVHDLIDLGIEVPMGDHTTVAGLVLSKLGRIPQAEGDIVRVGDWDLTVTGVAGRRITEVTLEPASPVPD
jgi:putative hemolysin